ncbi:hypothetical protein [Spirillospora sp. NPDC048819]|uniref:hypothetical protein n=1 Tax=Spirillospora sp. NPDC048819 TaxID=3155268 RepID=UPI0034053E0B
MPDRLTNVHPYERLTLPNGSQADIDLEMIPLMRALWAMGLKTVASCQNLGESITAEPEGAGQGRRHAAYLTGQAWLRMPTQDAQTMLGHLAQSPVFADRFGRWTHPDAWENYVYLLPGRDDDGVVQLSSCAQIHFPAPQILEVVDALPPVP